MDASSGPAAGVSTTLADWFATDLGRYLLAREQAYFDQTVADIFGFHALQVGLPECPFLAQSRIAVALDARLRPAGATSSPIRTDCRSRRTRSTSS